MPSTSSASRSSSASTHSAITGRLLSLTGAAPIVLIALAALVACRSTTESAASTPSSDEVSSPLTGAYDLGPTRAPAVREAPAPKVQVAETPLTPERAEMLASLDPLPLPEPSRVPEKRAASAPPDTVRTQVARDAERRAREASAPPSTSRTPVTAWYAEAQSLEDQNLFPQAVVVYDKILSADSRFPDAAGRRDTLVEFVKLADAYYVLALDSDSDAERENYLGLIRSFWPEYRDVSELLGNVEPREAGEIDS